MEMGEKPQSHRTTSGGGRGGYFFLCFTSRAKPTRLRTSTRGGGRSPAMFPSATAEPSSPKVTCIGQVRVKTSRMRRRRAAEVAGVRSRNRHRSWGHLPLRVVREALRSFGSEVNCCFGTRRSCCRLWRKEEVLGVMVVEEEPAGRTRGSLVADELQGELAFQKGGNLEIEEEVEGEVQAPCVPPKNALLLMRYRSDPARVSALQSRFNAEVEEEVDDGDKEQEEEEVDGGDKEQEEEEVGEYERQSQGKVRRWHERLAKDAGLGNGSTPESMAVIENDGDGEEIAAGSGGGEKEAEDEDSRRKKTKSVVAEEVGRSSTRKNGSRRSFSTEKEMRRSTSHREGRRSSFSSGAEARSRRSMDKEAKRRWSFTSEKESKAMAPAAKKEKNDLPECLLLMMCEPKLSMEVSKETWVSTSDFLRWEPHRRRQRHGGGERPTAEVENKLGVTVVERKEQLVSDDGPTAEPPLMKEGGSDVSDVSDGVMTAAAPFALTRCKSEPTRLAPPSPEGYLWNWKSMPRLIGPAGIGF